MNIEEARKVLWLRPNMRPLGELLDDGVLTRDNLSWAVRWAYNAKLRQAAKILLESDSAKKEELADIDPSQAPIEIKMRLDQARKVKWPIRPFKGQPMGELVETRKISLKDLGYAIENTWDDAVRQAAITLSLVRMERILKEPPPEAGFVKVITSGKSHSERRQEWLTIIEGMILGMLLALIIVVITVQTIYFLRPHPNTQPIKQLVSSPNGFIALISIVGLGVLFAWLTYFIPDQITKRLDKQIEAYKRGDDGEERTVQLIIQALDGTWTIFRNVNLPGRNKGDLDIVLVGPPGVWVLEVKNLSGDYRNIGEDWEYRGGKKWKHSETQPSRQAKNNASRLGEFLQADHIKIFVKSAIVWANEETSPFVENPTVPVWELARLPDELGNIWQGEKLTKEECIKIGEKFKKLFETGKKRREKNRP